MSILQFAFSFIVASTVYVPSDYSTIQAAINASSSGDSIMVLPGTYYTDIDFSGKDVHVESTDGPDSTLLFNCNITIDKGESRAAVLKGFRVEGDVDYYVNVIEIENSDPTIVGNVFCNYYCSYCGAMYEDAKNGCVIGLVNSAALIEGNEFIDNDIYWDSYFSGSDYSILRGFCIYIENLVPGDQVEIRNNHFIDNDGTFYSVYVWGYCVYASGNVLFDNNLFHNNGSSTNWYDKANAIYCEEASEVSITNSTFFENGYQSNRPVILVAASASCEIRNCIIWENALSGSPNVEYSDVQNGFSGIGNIDENPQFVTDLLSDCHLGSGSLCIDAGDPDSSYSDPEDPDLPGYAAWPALESTTNDMGVYGGPGAAYWNDPVTAIEQTSAEVVAQPLEILSISPNPSNSVVNIEAFLSEAGSVDLLVYDISGHVVRLAEDMDLPAGTSRLSYTVPNSGVYFCRITGDNHSAFGCFTVIR